MSASNLVIIRRFLDDTFNIGDLDAAAAILAPTYVDHGLSPNIAPDRPRLRAFVTSLRAAFPDLWFTIEDLLADDDRVMARWTIRGTHAGAFLGIAPTGNRIEYAGVTIFSLEAGRITESWTITEALGLVRQLTASRT